MFQKIRSKLDNKNILILGLGKEGKSTLFFVKKYIDYKSLTVADKNIVSDVDFNGINVIFGQHYMDTLDSYDVIIKSPGIVYDDVDKSIFDKTTSQTDLFMLEFSNQTVGITGTKGKSTTTTLIHHILVSAGKNAVILGNIGVPPLSVVEKIQSDTIAVFEMSCHQLEFANISPRVAVVLNLFEDHLDHYKTRDKYVKAKENIFLNQNADDLFIVFDECQEQISKAISKVITVGKQDNSDYCVLDRVINKKYVIPKDISLIGEHNYFNIAISYVVAKIFGVNDDDINNALRTYNPLPHRLEFVAKKNNVDYYDDSISTIPQTTIQAIKSLGRVNTIILGGMDRGIDYSDLIDFLCSNPVKNIVLLPNTGERIGKDLIKNGLNPIFCQDLAEAVSVAYKVTEPGGQCVLSPAAASYGFFKNFEERGDCFKKLVLNL